MRKKILRTILLLLLLMCALCACKKQTEPSVAEPEDSRPMDSTEQKPEPAAEPEIEEESLVSIEVEATATSADILVNGSKVSIGAYNIDGNNYVSIRDLAYVLDGSRASFDIGWDARAKSIALTTGQAYTPTGDELSGNGSGKVSAWSIVSPVLFNGEGKMLDGYTVGNVSYFSLKNMSEVLDFSMGWFKELRCIVINTEKSCGEEPLTLEEEYELIINSRQWYRPVVSGLCEMMPGLCYADYIDFDSDGSVELLLISVKENAENNGRNSIYAMIEVYGASDGHAVQYGDLEEELADGYYNEITINEYNSNTYVHIMRKSKTMSLNLVQTYYSVQDGALVLKNQTHSGFLWTEEGGRDWSYYDMDEQKITEEQYYAIGDQYAERTSILTYEYYVHGVSISDSGILPVSLEASIVVNGEKINPGSEFHVENKFMYGENGCLMAPLRPVLEAMGIPVYNNKNGTVIVASTKKDTLTIMDGGWLMWGDGYDTETNWGLYETNIKFNGEEQSLPVVPEYKNKQLFVPISSIVRMFGATAEWDESSRTLRITSNIASTSLMSKDELNTMIKGFTYEEAISIAKQAGYIHTWYAYTIYDYFSYKNGKAFYSFYTLPVGVNPDDTDLRYYTTVGSDGSISMKETTYDWENDI